ncbi:unnamed protein product [Lymnaea stagnalis]|uniref:Protein quiver n=1 Tax=Lymnaea stagnalis TaxID=6523 RepID=A0AAV2HWS0_LYMST
MCFECSSGAPGSWQNEACPANGKLKGWARQPIKCNGQCVATVKRWPLGDIVRSCSGNYYFASPPPKTGCIRRNDEITCFCSSNRCNDMDMLDWQATLLNEFRG